MRRAEELELGISPRPPGTTLQRWLYGELRAAILSGRIAPGRRLPSTRDLARQQNTSRSTVLSVYEQLIAEGYLCGTTGSGTTVTRTLKIPEPLQPGSPGTAAEPPGRRLSRQGELMANSPFPLHEAKTAARPFRPNQPDLQAFPVGIWNTLSSRCGKLTSATTMDYGEAAGYRPLRQAIADHLRYAQRITCTADQVMILSSAQQGLDLCARLLLDAGTAALVEDPGYPGAARIFELTGARVIDIAVDRTGLCLDPPLPVGPDIRLAYVTATHQSPLGGCLSVERRLALLAWAEACGATIIEDDYDGEYRIDGIPPSCLKSLDRNERVIYMGTFSKLLFPSLRLAYVVVPEWLSEAFASALSLTCRHTPVFPQAVLAAFISEGHFARHLRHMRVRYGERAAAFMHECATQLAGRLEILPITTGLDATALLPAGSDDQAVAAALGRQGIEARPISFYRRSHATPPGLVLGFSAFDPVAIRDGVSRMAPVLASILP